MSFVKDALPKGSDFLLSAVLLCVLLSSFALSELCLIHPSSSERERGERETHRFLCVTVREREREGDLEEGMWIPVCLCE